MADIIFRRHLDEVERAVRSALDIGMEAVGQQAEGNAEREVTKLVYDTQPSPTYVRTGDLRKYLTHDYVQEEKAVYVGSPLEYAPYVEYGTVNMPERPFLRNAVQNYSEEYKSILADALDKL